MSDCFKDYRTLSFQTKVSIDDLFLDEITEDYSKKNGESEDIIDFKLLYSEEDGYNLDIEFSLSEEDINKKLIIIENCYKIKFTPYYGFYPIQFGDENTFYVHSTHQPNNSFSFIVDDNFIYSSSSYSKTKFTKITKNEYYVFNKQAIQFALRDKRVKINIKNELNPEFLSKFSSDEIEQINFSLNEMILEYDVENLVYQKAIHDIFNYKDKLQVYYVVFCPHMSERNESVGCCYSEGQQYIIIKKVTINNLEVPNCEENKVEPGNNVFHGFYISNKNLRKPELRLDATFGFYELECESAFEDYFQFAVHELLSHSFEPGCSYKYILQSIGVKMKYINQYPAITDYNCKKEDNKTIFVGYLDAKEENYNEKEYIEISKSRDENFDINTQDNDDRYNGWKMIQQSKCYPDEIELVY